MKSCDYVKGRLGLSKYRNDDVFKGYKIFNLENRPYISDEDEKKIYNNIENIRIRVIETCKPIENIS